MFAKRASHFARQLDAEHVRTVVALTGDGETELAGPLRDRACHGAEAGGDAGDGPGEQLLDRGGGHRHQAKVRAPAYVEATGPNGCGAQSNLVSRARVKRKKEQAALRELASATATPL